MHSSLIGKIEKAQRYEHEPERVTIGSLQADFKGERRFAPYLRLYLAGNPLSDAAKAEQLAELKKIGVRLEDAAAVGAKQ